jgi:hypothetical protein
MSRSLTLSLALALASLSLRPAAPAAEDVRYAVREIEGWSVHVDTRLLGEDPPGPDALELLRVKLFEVRRTVPAAALAKLREVPIWLSADDGACACACYHPSPEWLRENGHDEAKARAVEITRAELFVAWSLDQPSMVLHELAHAYHHRELGYDDPRLVAALERVRAAGTFDAVLRYDGSTQRHYALESPMELFAEMSEAWFGVNDFWPFVRAEVLSADPETAGLLREIWGG